MILLEDLNQVDKTLTNLSDNELTKILAFVSLSLYFSVVV